MSVSGKVVSPIFISQYYSEFSSVIDVCMGKQRIASGRRLLATSMTAFCRVFDRSSPSIKVTFCSTNTQQLGSDVLAAALV
ncbi:hypothetical protein SCG7086_AD_00150 [Chlamydiales bacterium SCGC AG-110-P3]|nr:hypothetical protein SCG7086_AD_00150 [Chlamydiales bacterium SCGC AG-110-P3]